MKTASRDRDLVIDHRARLKFKTTSIALNFDKMKIVSINQISTYDFPDTR